MNSRIYDFNIFHSITPCYSQTSNSWTSQSADTCLFWWTIQIKSRLWHFGSFFLSTLCFSWMSNSRTSQFAKTCLFWWTVWMNSRLWDLSSFSLSTLCFFQMNVRSMAHNHPCPDLMVEIYFLPMWLTFFSWLDLMTMICPWSNPMVTLIPGYTV